MLEAPQTLLLSTGVVTASEIGDKTMLMAICLAARFRRPALIIWGILVATVLNHAMAGGVGAVLATLITPEILRWILIVSFAAMAAWMLVPDKLDDEETDEGRMKRFGVFGTTVVLFFLAETIDIDLAIVSVGVSPNPIVPSSIKGLELGRKGTIAVNDSMQSSIPTIYAGGDIVRGGATVILAMGDGRKAAAAMNEQLKH